MFERVAADLLSRLLGEYLEGINAANLGVALWGGDLTLENVSIRKSALDFLDLPYSIKEGFVGRLRLQLPWRALRSKPAIVTLERVLLLAERKAPSREARRRKEDESKAKKLAAAEEQDRATFAQAAGLQAAASSSAAVGRIGSWVEKLLTSVLSNVQVIISSVHFRFEDAVTSPEHPFAFGVTMEALSARSCDARWQPAYVDPGLGGAGFLYKLLRWESFAVYWDYDTPPMRVGAPSDWAARMLAQIPGKGGAVPGQQCLLAPVTANIRLTMWLSSGAVTSASAPPKFDVEVEFDEIAYRLADAQYRDLLWLLEAGCDEHEGEQEDEDEEEEEEGGGEAGGPAARWRRAVGRLIRRRRRRWRWARILERARARREYVIAYGKRLLGAEGPEERAALARLERALSLEEVLLFRAVAKDEGEEGEEEEDEEEEGTSRGQSWGAWAASWVWEQFYRAVDAEIADLAAEGGPAAPPSGLARDWDQTRLRIAVPAGSLSLVRAVGAPPPGYEGPLYERPGPLTIIRWTFSDLGARLALRPDSYRLESSMRTMAIHAFDRGEMREVVCRAASKQDVFAPLADERPSHHASLFRTAYESRPSEGSAHPALALYMQPLQVTYTRFWVKSAVAFFDAPASAPLAGLQAAALSRLEDLRAATQRRVEAALAQHHATEVFVDVQAPIVLIPDVHDPSGDGAALVADFGRLTVTSDLRSPAQRLAGPGALEGEDAAYDRFAMRFSGLQLQLCPRLSRAAAASEQLLDRFDLAGVLALPVLSAAELPAAPRCRLSLDLPNLALSLSTRQSIHFARVINACRAPRPAPGPAPAPAPAPAQAPASFAPAGKRSFGFDAGATPSLLPPPTPPPPPGTRSRPASTRPRPAEELAMLDEWSSAALGVGAAPPAPSAEAAEANVVSLELRFAVGRIALELRRERPGAPAGPAGPEAATEAILRARLGGASAQYTSALHDARFAMRLHSLALDDPLQARPAPPPPLFVFPFCRTLPLDPRSPRGLEPRPRGFGRS
eukprot:tig00000615_g2579.t1